MGSAGSVCLNDDCPDEAELRALLNGGVIDESRLAWLEDCLSECEGCRGRLDQLSSAGSETVGAVVGAVVGGAFVEPEIVRSEALSKVVSRVKAREFGEGFAGDLKVEPDLGFLDRAESGDQLGRLGKYEVSEVIAEGGMGLVLRARDPDLDREVAIKVLSPRLAANSRARKLFLREARAAAGIEQENVLPIYLVEQSGALPWFVMPLIRGGNLEDRLRERGDGGGIDFSEVLETGLKVARGLAAAHARGIVHRDIKPANVMLDEDGGNVWLADFGLAAAVETGEGGGRITGTPGFMAPEVVAGEPADQRSDLFSLGCVFFAMVTGRQAFSGETVEALLEAVKTDEPAFDRMKGREIPRWFEELVGHLLAKSPGERLGSARELVEILERHTEEVRKAAWRARVWRRLGRGLAAVAGGLAVIAGILWLLSVSGRTQGVNRALSGLSGDAFSVKGRFGVHETLGAAAAAAPDGAVIEIFGDASWETHPVSVEGKALTIRAAGNGVPVLRSVSETAPMISSDSELNLEGLILEHSVRPKKGVPSLVLATRSPLSLRRCRLLSPHRPRESGLAPMVGVLDCALLKLSDVEFQAKYSYGVGFLNDGIAEPCDVQLENVVYLGPMFLMLVENRTSIEEEALRKLEARIVMRHCTVLSGTLIHVASAGAVYPITVTVEKNAFDCEVGLLTSVGNSPDAARGFLRWIDRENVYAVPTDMFFGQGRGTFGNPMPRTRAPSRGWDDLKEWWGLERGGSKRVGRIFTEATRERFSKSESFELGSLEFAEEYQAESGNAGADLNRVGPARRP